MMFFPFFECLLFLELFFTLFRRQQQNFHSSCRVPGQGVEELADARLVVQAVPHFEEPRRGGGEARSAQEAELAGSSHG